MKTVEQIVFDIIKEIRDRQRRTGEITRDSMLKYELNMDSLNLVELIVTCEEHFNIEIDTDNPELLDIKTVGNLCDAIEKSINSN